MSTGTRRPRPSANTAPATDAPEHEAGSNEPVATGQPTPTTRRAPLTVAVSGLTLSPPKRTSKGRKSQFDFDGMEVGSAFLVRPEDEKQIRSAAMAANRRHSVEVPNKVKTHKGKEIPFREPTRKFVVAELPKSDYPAVKDALVQLFPEATGPQDIEQVFAVYRTL